ncbi:MAG TPA: hypothetical protein VJ253_02535, partial [Dehalococcoidia bacterium]|nr:hypothetical protein [Dehalococcoidia bacterium]
AAGGEAALRGHEVVVEVGRQDPERETVPVITWQGLVRYQDTAAVDLRVAVLPEGRDPDDVIRSDPDGWRELIASAPPVLDYRFQAASTRNDTSTPQGRSEAVQELLPLLEPISDPVVRAHYLQRLSRLSLMREEELARLTTRRRPNLRRAAAVTPEGGPPLVDTRGESRREEFLLALLLRYPELREAGLELPEGLLWEAANRELMAAWKRSAELETVKEALPEELDGRLERLVMWRLPDYSSKEAERALLDCRQRLERRQVEAEKRATAALLADREEEMGASALAEATASDADTEDEMVREAIDLQKKDLETGLKLHARERKEPADEAAETTVNG